MPELGVASQQNLQDVVARLQGEHRELEQRLDEIESHLSLTPEEELERTRLKKLKLLKKDQLLALTRR